MHSIRQLLLQKYLNKYSEVRFIIEVLNCMTSPLLVVHVLEVTTEELAPFCPCFLEL
jgi:acyl carrier protein phosphodiesterase